jgi:hypothetical protein
MPIALMHLHLPRRNASGSGSLGSRAWAWVHQFKLDRELADGADPGRSPALQARAHQLVGTHFRRELVAQLDAVLDKAEHPPHWHSVSLPVRALEVRAAHNALAALRQALKDPGAPCVRGVALAACLINDPDGPLYHQTGADIAQLADVATASLTAHAGRSGAEVGSA